MAQPTINIVWQTVTSYWRSGQFHVLSADLSGQLETVRGPKFVLPVFGEHCRRANITAYTWHFKSCPLAFCHKDNVQPEFLQIHLT